MNYPVEFVFGPFSISAHFVFELLAFFLGFRYYLYLRKRSNDVITESNRLWIIVGAAFGAFLFSRLIGALESPYQWIETEYPLLYFFKNKTIVGGLLGGLFGVELIKRVIGEKKSSGDLFTFPLILAMMIGRIGCFSSGIYEATFGIPTEMPWGMDLGDGFSRHPVALYEILFLGLLWIILFFIKTKYTLKSGYLFQFFMISYLLFRFFLDFIKPGFKFDIGLTTIQITCILGLLYYIRTIVIIFIKPAKLLNHEPK